MSTDDTPPTAQDWLDVLAFSELVDVVLKLVILVGVIGIVWSIAFLIHRSPARKAPRR
jgi:hypothetical protein